jgi:aspartyl-tRNA(Asn)/glutamyl-tRNA(Gln) amidotransferase subunit A
MTFAETRAVIEARGLEALLEDLLARERAAASLNAFIGFDARRAAEEMRHANLRAVGPLAGVPLAVKDNIVCAGAPVTCGSRILGDFRSPVDAGAVARLRNAGAWVFGRTNLDEFAMGSSTEHSAFGPVRNPWDHSRVPGGSSGGSAAAVAARIVPAALGSDTGGSVRQPAAFCGIFGLKPTWGRVSRSGLVAFASSLDQIGVFATTACDCADVLSAMAGSDVADATSSRVPVDDYAAGIQRGIGGMRFGIVSEALAMLDGESRANFDAAVAVIRRLGASVAEVSIPTLRSAVAVYSIVANAEASANLARFDGIRYGARTAADDLGGVYRSTRTAGFGPEVKRRIMLGTFALSSGYYDAYYGRAQKVRALMTREFDAAFNSCDLLLTPTTPGPAFALGAKTKDPLAMYLSDVFTVPANLVGIPAIAVPSGFGAEGLPLSLQIMGRHFREADILRAAYAFGEETRYYLKTP